MRVECDNLIYDGWMGWMDRERLDGSMDGCVDGWLYYYYYY